MTTENKFLVVEDKDMQAKIDAEIKKIKDIATKKVAFLKMKSILNL